MKSGITSKAKFGCSFPAAAESRRSPRRVAAAVASSPALKWQIAGDGRVRVRQIQPTVSRARRFTPSHYQSPSGSACGCSRFTGKVSPLAVLAVNSLAVPRTRRPWWRRRPRPPGRPAASIMVLLGLEPGAGQRSSPARTARLGGTGPSRSH
jgi:hypothetical protein